MHKCSKCNTVLLPSLEDIKIPYGRISKDGHRLCLELSIEDGISLRKVKKRVKNTFGLELSIDQIWYLIQRTGTKCEMFVTGLNVSSSGVVCYDEDILRKTNGNAVKMTLLDAVYGYAIKEDVKENKSSSTIKSFMIDGLKNTNTFAIVTDCDPKYPKIIKHNFPHVLHQNCVGHFKDIIDDDLRKAAGLNYCKKKDLPEEYLKLKSEIYSIFYSKNRLIAEKSLYCLLERKLGKDKDIDAILMKTKAYFYNLTHFMEDSRIPKTNNILESRYSTMESNYNNNRRFKTTEGAKKYVNCQTLYRDTHVIEERTYINTSPYGRAGFDHHGKDWLNLIGFGDNISNAVSSCFEGVVSKITHIIP